MVMRLFGYLERNRDKPPSVSYHCALPGALANGKELDALPVCPDQNLTILPEQRAKARCLPFLSERLQNRGTASVLPAADAVGVMALP